MRDRPRGCRRSVRTFLTLALALMALAAGAAGASAAAAPASSPLLSGHPLVVLPAPASGSAAVEALGLQLPGVAKAYGWTPGQLTSRLSQDRSLNVDTNGYLFYKDPAPTASDLAAAAVAAAAAPGAAPQALAPLADTFKLHSLPGAAHIIYLDFDGYTLHADAWTAGYNSGYDIVAPPYDTDGNPASFSDAELTAIQQVWQRMAEDYAPFNVDVTTEYLGEDYLTRSSSADDLYGMRVLISPISSYIGNYGGMAYVGAFSDVGDYYKPALVLSDKLGGGNEKYVAEAASHENGHTLGLTHQGANPSTEYYPGQGSGVTGWAPIMGAGYYKNLTQWSKGEYANANNTEDELAVMGSYGAPGRTDDVGGTTTSATYLGTTGTLTASGIIGTYTDADVFGLTWAAGPLNVSAAPAERGPDLDILLDLLDSNGSPIASDNPVSLLTAGVSANVAPGAYFIRVRGTGKGNPLVDGYSNYGSLGAYTISATVPPVPPAAPTITLLDPTGGPTAGSTSIAIAGSDLTGATAVTFGGTVATSFVVNSGTQITAIAPAHAAGSVSVLVTTPGGVSADTGADDYTYLAPITRQLSMGWNLLAGDAGSDAGGCILFGFGGSAYISRTAADMEPGQGYWCDSSSSETVSLGASAPPLSIELSVGWNLIGNSTAGTVSLPQGQVAFRYQAGGYSSSNVLPPGEGAWVKSETAQTIVLE